MIRLPQWTELDEEIREFPFNLSEAHFVRQILQFPAEN